MAKNLVIVESPSKAKTIKKYLGTDFEVIASQGHIIDLPASRFAVDVDNDFKPEYIKMKGKAKIIKQIKDEAKDKENIFLATDPDREGEAIAWHIRDELKIPQDKKCRVEFHEITETAVKNGIKSPRILDMNIINAQQARRILDRIVGYKISPLLWKKVKRGLSAGRVQSAALKVIVDRENEIRQFVPQEYWVLEAVLSKDDTKQFVAKFYGDRNGKIDLCNGFQVKEIISKIDGRTYTVEDIKVTEKRRMPPPPFTTSSMQQDAGRKLGFTVKKTMMIAQKLYEAGYITYMRTDSTRVSDDAIKMAKAYICKSFGENYYLNRNFKAKEGAQDAHEAIRPTKLLDLEKTIASMEKDEAKLYALIFNRFVASKMEACVYDSTKILIDVENYIFTVTGSVIKFDGFMRLYTESKDEGNVKDKDESDEIKELPKLDVGDKLKQCDLISSQKFTEPPSRYTEASLVKVMEEKGIGRPSTYAPTISTLLDRLYIQVENKHLIPTELGEIVNGVMSNNFKDIVDVEFTANMEKELDNIADGKQDYIKMLHAFYNPFIKNLETVSATMESVKIPDKVSDEVCELCGRQMVIKQSRFGEFLACPGYPECKNTKPILKAIKEPCPKCGGKVLVRKTKTRKNFYVCESNTNNENSKCDYISWNKPGQENTTKKTRKTVKKKTTKKK